MFQPHSFLLLSNKELRAYSWVSVKVERDPLRTVVGAGRDLSN